jgi:homoserine O-acetyltransferase
LRKLLVKEETVAIGALQLDCGGLLPAVEQRVTIYGTPNADGSNVALVPHALTGSSRVADWWPAMLAHDAPLDLRRWCVVGINALGSCYGSTGPKDDSFPTVSVADVVRAQARALGGIGIRKVHWVIGASLGGMQALQWALDFPERVSQATIIGAHDHQSAMGIALNALQRDAIALDPKRGVRLARKIAMLSYKSDDLLKDRHERRPDRKGRPYFDVEGYLDHQADLFEARMDPRAYVSLTKTMDSQDVRDRSSHNTNPRLRFIGISSDWLFRPQEIRAAVARLTACGFATDYRELTSTHGHDAFLAEPRVLTGLLC